jgi:hypothetical protein
LAAVAAADGSRLSRVLVQGDDARGRRALTALFAPSQRQHQPNFERYALTDEEWYSVVIGSAAPAGATSLFD